MSMRFYYVDPFLTCVPARYYFPAIELLQLSSFDRTKTLQFTAHNNEYKAHRITTVQSPFR
jgi:hypothetical protein